MNELKVFQFENDQEEKFETRVIILGGQPWWVAKDVSDLLGYSQTQKMLNLLYGDEISAYKIEGVNADSWIINESGVYSAILSSKKPEAKKFRKWVTSELLPQIRATGSYLSPADQKLLDQVKSGQLLLIDPKQQERKSQIIIDNKKLYILPEAAAAFDMKEQAFYDVLEKLDLLYIERRNGPVEIGLSAKCIELRLGKYAQVHHKMKPCLTKAGMLWVVRELGV